MVRLAISAGMDGIPTETIPGDPKEFVDWFKGVGIKRWFGPADVRNVVQGSGIAITNNGFNSPPTIAISQDFQALFAQPYVLLGTPVGAPLTDYRSLEVQPLVLGLTDGGAESGLTIAVLPNGIGNAQFRQAAPMTVVGNIGATSANVADLTQAQLTSLINLATTSLSGAIPLLSGHSTDYFSGAGAFTALPTVSVPTAANPTASVGLSVVNGIATTFMRSDGAPALSQAISPTMTGAWTFSPAGAGVIINAPASGAALALSGLSNTSSVLIQSNATSAQNVTDVNVQRANGSTINTLGAGCGIGLQDTANSNATRIQNSGGQTEFWQANAGSFSQVGYFATDRGMVLNAATGASKGTGTINVSGGYFVNGSAIAGANPGTTVTMAAQNGTATTYMRSDAAPALNPAINPTMTGNWTFTPSSGTGVQINGLNGANALGITANSTAGGSFGIQCLGGTNSSDASARFFNQAGSTIFFNIRGDGKLLAAGPIGLNGVAPPTQVAGWGTPTGASVQTNFAGGAATLVTLGAAVAKIITDLKALGLYSA